MGQGSKLTITSAIDRAPTGPGTYVLYTANGRQSRGLATNLKQRLSTHKVMSARYGCPVTHASFEALPPGSTYATLRAAELRLKKGAGDTRELELVAPTPGPTHHVVLLGTTARRAAAIAAGRRLPRQATWMVVGAGNRDLAASAARAAATRSGAEPPAVVAAMVPVGVLQRLRRSGPGYFRPHPLPGPRPRVAWRAEPEAIDLINRHIDAVRVYPAR